MRAGEVEIVARADELEHGSVPKIGREVDNITAGVHSGFRWAGEDGGAEVGGFGAVVADAFLADAPLGGLLVVQEGVHSAELRADAHRLARGRCDKCFELLPACVRWLQRNLMLPQRRWLGTPKRGFGKENCSAALLRADAPVPHRLHLTRWPRQGHSKPGTSTRAFWRCSSASHVLTAHATPLLCRNACMSSRHTRTTLCLCAKVDILIDSLSSRIRAHEPLLSSASDVSPAESGEIIGCGTLLVERKLVHSAGLSGHIEDIATAERARGRGIASSIVNALLDECRRRGCYKAILDCTDSNASFYERLGFKRNELQLRHDLDNANATNE